MLSWICSISPSWQQPSKLIFPSTFCTCAIWVNDSKCNSCNVSYNEKIQLIHIITNCAFQILVNVLCFNQLMDQIVISVRINVMLNNLLTSQIDSAVIVWIYIKYGHQITNIENSFHVMDFNSNSFIYISLSV